MSYRSPVVEVSAVTATATEQAPVTNEVASMISDSLTHGHCNSFRE